jgi:glutamyl-tRNA synthetase
MSRTIRTRYAPSPTGKMHVGNLRTALYAYLIAKHEQGDFLLRIEDTDQERFVEGAIDIIYRTMKQAGLEHDEGPDKDGGVGPYIQSERQKTGIYLDYAKQLITKGEAYYCFCDKERLESLRTTMESTNETYRYDKHCLNLTPEDIQNRLDRHESYVIRQNNPSTGSTTFNDVIYGDITVENSELEDMVLIKADGFPTYNFANVIDDYLMKITHVVRGNEYLSSSPKYNRLYEAFGWEVPVYVHCPLITDEEHKKLSKRLGHASYEDLLELGFLNEAIINFVALLGWSSGNNEEIFSLEKLIEIFDYTHINKSPAVFDMKKFRWMNSEYIKRMDATVFFDLVEERLKKLITFPNLDLKKIAALAQTRLETLNDLDSLIDFFNGVPDYDKALYVHKKMKTDAINSIDFLQQVLPVLEAQEVFELEALHESVLAFVAEKD